MPKQLHNTATDALSSSGQQLIVLPHETSEQRGDRAGGQAGPRPAGTWLHYTNLKVEAAIFLLIALTFAAVLGQGALTGQQLLITPARSAQYFPYVYGDKDSGGKSTVTYDSTRPLTWSCTLQEGFANPYCGYGLFVGENLAKKGLDFSHYQDIMLHLTYHGPGKRLKLMLKNNLPASLRDKVKNDDTMPLSAEFDVANGDNEIHLTSDQLAIESWWVTQHSLTPEEDKPALGNVVAIALGSGGAAPVGHFDVAVQSITFKGVFLSTAQWYLIILGVWLVLTGAFLVYRFMSLRRGYEIRQRRQAEESEVLAAARAAAEAASAAKSQFLANMSHELRTPLNAILGYAQLLKDANLTEQQLSGVKTIHQSGEHLLTLITDILDIAKVEAGKMELLAGPTDVRICISTVAQMIRLRAEEKGLRFTVDIAEDVPQTVVADQKRIRQVLINLLGNAVKFTEAGEVRLEVSGARVSDDDVRLRFDIVDSGIGIRADQIDRIFRPFEQAGNAIDRSGGTGLGLSITHQIVRMMQGDIRVESTIGEGSRFIVEAPFHVAAADAGAASAMATPSGRTYDILIADNNEANRSLLRTALEAQGCRVREARNGLEAITVLEQAGADLVLMDLKMPVMDGFEATRRIRANPLTAKIPVIAVTANPSAEAKDAAKAAGADCVASKPIDLEALKASIVRLLSPHDAPALAQEDAVQEMIAPSGDQMERLVALARAGNLGAIRKEIPAILALGPQYRAFSERLDTLAAAYQSPAVLRLVEQYAQQNAA